MPRDDALRQRALPLRAEPQRREGVRAAEVAILDTRRLDQHHVQRPDTRAAVLVREEERAGTIAAHRRARQQVGVDVLLHLIRNQRERRHRRRGHAAAAHPNLLPARERRGTRRLLDHRLILPFCVDLRHHCLDERLPRGCKRPVNALARPVVSSYAAQNAAKSVNTAPKILDY